MARGEHLRQFQFQEGNPGGPGRPASPISEKELVRYTREHVADVINKVMELKDQEIDQLLLDQDTPQFEKTVAKVMLQARKDGDFTQMDKLLDRCVGKVPQKIEGELFGKGGVPLIPSSITLAPVRPAGEGK